MINIKQFREDFFNRTVIMLSLSIMGFISFFDFFEKVIANLIVSIGFFYPEEKWYNDIFFFAIIFFIIIYTYATPKSKPVDSKYTSILLLITFFYLYIRNANTQLELIPLSLTEFVKYADLILVFTSCQLLLIPFNYKNKKKTKSENNKLNKKTLLEDLPLGENEEDILGYAPYANRLAEKILESHFEKSFAIGVNGKWGVGKTSFFNLIKRHFRNKDVIEIDFNPWKSSNSNMIIKDFFELILEKISLDSYSTSKKIKQYSKKLASANGSSLIQSTNAIVETLFGDESTETLYKNINKAFIKIDKKIIVYIDDVDRLDYDEAYEVLRLIRNTGNFHNTIFIVAYDRDYIVNLLSQHNLHNSSVFLEKIFQFEISLPYFDKHILKKLLVEKLLNICPVDHKASIEKTIVGDYNINNDYLDNWLDHVRDVTKIANSLTINLDTLWGDVEFSDFFRMELLRIKYPSVHRLIHKQTNEFFTIKMGDYNWQYFILKDQYFEKYLKTNISVLTISESEIPKITNLLKNIFPDEQDLFLLKRSPLSIIYPSKFYRYFTFDLSMSNLSEIEFSKARSGSLKMFKEKITSWVEDGLSDEVKDKLIIIKDFDNRDDFEKIITAIFHFASLPLLKENSKGQILGFSNHDIYDKLNKTTIISKLYYQESDSDYILFVKSLFNKAKTPFKFESYLINFLLDLDGEEFPLTKDELNEIRFCYLKQYANRANKLDERILELFNSFKKSSAHNNDKRTNEEIKIHLKINNLMKELILNKDFDGFIENILYNPFNEYKTFGISGKVIVQIFGGWKPFLVELEKIKPENSKYINEFKEFIEAYKKTNLKGDIPFSFKTISRFVKK